MSFINSALRPLFDGILFPVRDWSPLLSLAILSLVIGVAMLFVFKHTSNQKGLSDIKRRIHAGLFEIRLFNDDPVAIFRAQGEILRHNLSYLRLSLVPMLWMIVPLFLVIAQLQFHYGYDGLVPGQSTLVKVKLAESAVPGGTGRPDVSLEAPPGLRVETPGVWVAELNEISWRIAAQDRGTYEMKLRVAGQDYAKSVQVEDGIVRRSPERFAPSFWKELLFPAEAPLPRGGAVESIAIAYPEREISVLGFGVHWIIVFFVLSMAFAFAFRSRVGVTF